MRCLRSSKFRRFPTLQDFFSSLQTLVSNAEDPAARQTVLGKADGVVNQLRGSISICATRTSRLIFAITSTVEQINNYTSQIASLNEQMRV
ncbi:FlgK family flagellar hook-associated protein [Escherichia coli]